MIAPLENMLTEQSHVRKAKPICVDLDGTLVNTDMLWETVCLLAKKNLLLLLWLPVWLASGGVSNLKAEIARRVRVDVSVLPFNTEVLEFIKQQHALGRSVELVTGTHKTIATAIADYLGVFSNVRATSDTTNLTGRHKAKELETVHGTKGFDYIGNDTVDKPVWSVCDFAHVVSRSDRFIKDIESNHNVGKTFKNKSNPIKTFISAIRIHQWIKNLLLFFPLLLDGRLADLNAWVYSATAFLVFGLVASGTYILNDLLDLQSDRRHEKKMFRPFASGAMQVKHGFALLVTLILTGVLISVLLLPSLFTLVLFSYLVTTVAYSLWLKVIPITDVCLLAGLYTIRLMAGTVAISAAWSFWLLAFSIFFFLSLAFSKRSSELKNLELKSRTGVAFGRGYQVADLSMVNTMGIASGYLSVLLIALYVNSDSVAPFYSTPQLLWAICPLLLYWISRTWLITARGEMDEDPIVFAIHDRVSWALALLIVTLVLLAARITMPEL